MPPGYQSYTDKNGVPWRVITTDNGFTLMGTVLDDADPRYDPPATDQTASMAQGGVQLGPVELVHTDPPTGDQTRVLMIELIGKIEEFAAHHHGEVTLQVTAHVTGLWVWLVGLGAVAFLIGNRRR